MFANQLSRFATWKSQYFCLSAFSCEQCQTVFYILPLRIRLFDRPSFLIYIVAEIAEKFSKDLSIMKCLVGKTYLELLESRMGPISTDPTRWPITLNAQVRLSTDSYQVYERFVCFIPLYSPFCPFCLTFCSFLIFLEVSGSRSWCSIPDCVWLDNDIVYVGTENRFVNCASVWRYCLSNGETFDYRKSCQSPVNFDTWTVENELIARSFQLEVGFPCYSIFLINWLKIIGIRLTRFSHSLNGACTQP